MNPRSQTAVDRTVTLLMATVILLLSSGCIVLPTFGLKTAYGTKIKSGHLRFVEKGCTTRQEIQDRFGKPYYAFEDLGLDVYYWQTACTIVIPLIHGTWDGFEDSLYVHMLEELRTVKGHFMMVRYDDRHRVARTCLCSPAPQSAPCEGCELFRSQNPHILVMSAVGLKRGCGAIGCCGFDHTRAVLAVERHPIFLSLTELAVLYSGKVRLIMNDLRTGRWSDPGTVINEPGIRRSGGQMLLVNNLRQSPQDNPRNLINDCQSHIKS